MISATEIEEKSAEFDIHTAHVQRDYVFGWLLAAIYGGTALRGHLVFKGGNAFRKAYFEATRFSTDLDFSTQSPVDPAFLATELNRACAIAQEASGVKFETEATRVEEKRLARQQQDQDRTIYQARLYFQDFYGNREGVLISIRMDVTELDRILLPIQKRNLIHPYSDAKECRAELRCVKLEELLASKLKCLLQRRHAYDLYDFIYSVFVKHEIDVNRIEIARAFLDKTIFRPNPVAARDLLLGLPFEKFREAWDKYIDCPKQAWIHFEEGLGRFREEIAVLFSGFGSGWGPPAFFPAHHRNPIMDAGSTMTLLRLTYRGIERLIEPYSLVYKRRQDNTGQEYLYAYDRTGGRDTGPGIKTFLAVGIERLEPTEEKFEPRYPVEISKAGEPGGKGYFGSPFSGSRRSDGSRRPRASRLSGRIHSGPVYVLQCPYCSKTFRRKIRSTSLGQHKDRYGNRCFGRLGMIINQRWS
jgi:predicted nucleotidyltransferase component of viral defense system